MVRGCSACGVNSVSTIGAAILLEQCWRGANPTGFRLKESAAISGSLHVVFAIVFMRDLEPQAFIEPQGGIDFHYGQKHRLLRTCCLADQPAHHFRAYAASLRRTVDKELSEKKSVVARHGLQPADIQTIKGDDPDLRQRPILAETGRLSRPIQFQLVNDPIHSGEVQALAIVEILGKSGAKRYLHCLYQ